MDGDRGHSDEGDGMSTDTPTDTRAERADGGADDGIDRAAIRDALYTDGITALKGAFPRAWAQQLREDVDAAFEEARGREGGAVGRGPQRWYVEIHPQALRGFVDLVDHPWVRATCETVLGPDYTIVEV